MTQQCSLKYYIQKNFKGIEKQKQTEKKKKSPFIWEKQTEMYSTKACRVTQ